MTTLTITAGRQQGEAIVPDNTVDWDELGSSPFGSWDSWTSWKITSTADVVVQLDDDKGSVDYRTPGLDLYYQGDVSVVLKISSTGAFAGEETTYNFSYLSEIAYTYGRYYRWIITVTANSDYSVPLLGLYDTRYSQKLYVEVQNDVDVYANPITTISTSLGVVKNIQATALQGDPYVVDGYIQTAAEAAAVSHDPVSITNNGVVLTDSDSAFNKFSGYPVYNFGLGGLDVQTFEFDTDLTPWEQMTSGDDYTIETFFYIYGSIANGTIFGQNDSGLAPTGDDSFNLVVDSTFSRLVYTAGPEGSEFALVTGTSSISTGQWYHVAIVKEGSNISLYLDGSRIDTTTYTGDILSTASVFIGGWDGNDDDQVDSLNFNGYMSNFRISAGARYSGSSYTVPTQRFDLDTHTLLLLRDRLQDESGDTPTDEYLIEQRGGSPVITSKNPPKVQVVDYAGTPWDGTVDLVLRGYQKIYLTDTGVVPVPI